MPKSAAGQVPGVPFEQCNHENWSYANEQKKDRFQEERRCPLLLSCTLNRKKYS